MEAEIPTSTETDLTAGLNADSSQKKVCCQVDFSAAPLAAGLSTGCHHTSGLEKNSQFF
jgi:hypothetical protein